MWVLWLVITAAIILLIVGLSRQVRNNRPTAEQILQQRFARGEIDEAEFNKRKAMLEKE